MMGPQGLYQADWKSVPRVTRKLLGVQSRDFTCVFFFRSGEGERRVFDETLTVDFNKKNSLSVFMAPIFCTAKYVIYGNAMEILWFDVLS